MPALLAWLGRRGPIVIAIGVFTGLLLPPLAAALRPLLVPAIILPFLIALVRVELARIAGALRRPGELSMALAWVLVLSPLAVHAVLLPMRPMPAIDTGLVLIAACPPLMASGALALMLGLDVALALVVTVTATALVPFTLAPLALGLLGVALEIETGAFMLRLALVVGGCFLAALGLRRLLSPAWIAARAHELDGLAVIGLLVFAIAIMDGVTALLLRDPAFVAALALAVLALNAGLQLAGALIFARLGLRRALTLGLVSGNNNAGLMLAALADRAPFELIVVVAVAQFPIYILPALQRPLYRRILEPTAGSG